MTYAALERTDEAISTYKLALQHTPDDYDVIIALGNILLSNGRVAEAREHFRHASVVSPSRPYAFFNLGLTYVTERDWKAARREFEKAVSVAPGDAQAHLQLGNVLSELGDIDGARREWERTLQLNPQNRTARQKLDESAR